MSTPKEYAMTLVQLHDALSQAIDRLGPDTVLGVIGPDACTYRVEGLELEGDRNGSTIWIKIEVN